MVIRNAAAGDLQKIMEIYARAREYMAANGNPNQWGPTNWPPLELVQEDIRMDTHGDNTIMQNLLTGLGFRKCGIIYVVEDDYPRYAYEKL